MSFDSRQAARFGTPWILIWGSAVVLIVLIIHGHRIGPFDPTHRQYGANWPGDVGAAVRRGVLGLALLVLIVRPWSYRRSWGRSLLGFVLFAPVGAFLLVAGMHAGPTVNAPGFWMLLVGFSCLIAAAISGWATTTHQRAA
jgi:hypothetical protein